MIGEAKARELKCFAGKLVAKLGVTPGFSSAITPGLCPLHHDFDISL